MTTVHVSMARDDGTGTLAAVSGSLYWEPTTRREDGTVVVLPVGFPMNLVAGEATKDVEPSGLTWCWRVTERVEDGTVRYVSVPDSATTVEYVDLPDVDPTTLVEWSPADPEAAYLAALADLDVAAAVETYLLANPVTAPVDSVNAQTGAVVLDAADVGAVAPADLATVATSGDYNDLSNRPTFKTVSNQTGAPIAADTLVEISGAFGIFVTVRVADNSTADHVAGITTAEIADGATGEIQVTGEVTGLNTSALTAGTPLYLSTSGGWTDTRPTAPAHVIRVGVAGVTHPTAGTIVFTLPSYEVLADNVDGLDAKVTELAEDPTSELGASLSDTYAPIPTGTPDGTKFYKDDGTWATPAGGGTGDVTGPAGAVAGNLAALDATGKVISDSGSAPADFAAASHTHAPADITGTAVITTDARLSDARTPTAHTHTASEISDATIATGSSVSGANTGDQDLSGYATTASLGDAATLDVGTTAGTVAAGDHTHAELHTHSNAVALAAVSGTNTGDEPDASTTVKGIVELATTTEATTGTDTTRAVTPAGVAAAIAGVGGGVTDHGALTGLADDDHTQYHTDDRGDARYVKKSDLTVTTGASVSGTNTGDQDLSGYVPTTRTINGDPLSANITLDAADVGAAPAVQSINAQTGTTYTLVAADASKLVTCTNAAAITVTVPDATFTAGQRVDILVLGAGMVTVAAGSGVTLNGTPSLVSRAQYSALTVLFLTASSAVVVGDLATP